jgi:predicted phosphodiesterase
MRIAIISDIHGNKIALDAVLQDLAQQPFIDQVVIAGDLCLNGPQPREVLETVWQMHCPVIQGNADTEVVIEQSQRGHKKQHMAGWVSEQIGASGVQYLANLPFSYLGSNSQGSDLLIVHANPLNQDESIYPSTPDSELEPFFGDLPSSIGAVGFGHLHVAYQRRWRHLLLVDTGSCGLPRDGDLRAAYAILTWQDNAWQAEHRRVPYDVAAVIRQIEESDMLNKKKRIKVLTEAKY